MNVTFALTPEDVHRLNKEYFSYATKSKRPIARIALLTILSVEVVGLWSLAIYSGHWRQPAGLMSLVISVFMFLVSLSFMPLYRQYTISKKANDPLILQSQQIELGEDYVTLRNFSQTDVFDWFYVFGVIETANYVFFALRSGNHYMIPVSAFPDASLAHEFIQTIKSKASSHLLNPAGAEVSGSTATSWPPPPQTGETTTLGSLLANDIVDPAGVVATSNAVELQYTLTKRDLIWLSLRSTFVENFVLMLPGIFGGIGYGAAGVSAIGSQDLVHAASYILIWFFFWMCLLLSLYTATARRFANAVPAQLLTRRVSTDFVRMIVEDGHRRSSYHCEYLKKSVKTYWGVLIQGQVGLEILPRRCFADRTALNEFQKKMQSAIKAAKSQE